MHINCNYLILSIVLWPIYNVIIQFDRAPSKHIEKCCVDINISQFQLLKVLLNYFFFSKVHFTAFRDFSKQALSK